MKVKVWGARGSVPAPGPQMNRYGGDTYCVQLTLDGGEQLILDAGTGIRNLGLDLNGSPKVNILLTHLHLDHIQGLMFFPPCFRRTSRSRSGARPRRRPRSRTGSRATSRRLSPRSRSGSCPARSRSGTPAERVASAPPRSGPRRSPTAGPRSATGSPRTRPASVTSPTTSRGSVPTLADLEPGVDLGLRPGV